MNDYLKNMLAMYRDKAYLETNLGLMAQQAEVTVPELLKILVDQGVQFRYKPHWFTVGKEGNRRRVHAKESDMIVLNEVNKRFE